MATDPGKNIADLMIDQLQNDAPNFNVFQAIRLSEMISKAMHPDRKNFELDQGGILIRPYELYSFPPKDVRSIEIDSDDPQNPEFRIVLNFMGLYGINAALPFCYHEEIALQQNPRGPGNVALQELLDIFNNRLYWFYYHAWKKYRYQFNLQEDSESGVRDRVFSFIGRGPGMGQEARSKGQGAKSREKEAKGKKQGAGRISPMRLLQFSGILSLRVRNKAGLLVLLRNFFPRFDVEIDEFVPRRIEISELPGLGGKNGGIPQRLGDTGFLGRSKIDYMSRIRIVIGPIAFEDYLHFTPEGKHAALLRELLALYLNDGLTYDVRFLIQSHTIASISWNDRRLKLGSTIWLGRPKTQLAKVNYTYEKYAGAD